MNYEDERVLSFCNGGESCSDIKDFKFFTLVLSVHEHRGKIILN